ncbi:DNA primase [Mariluticola halotolerans]|uniref:DNA primase n=1 Tax=Mariluticola halotolerans TaxID=2909283 RepID=UPI0026E29436|nr:DNA primase [Mariluticola halotolerans]UJQ94510.1 DNA primase [Mariluticola halotolerans]
MRFSDAFLDDIRNRLPITQVVGQHVIWDKRKSQPGKGDMWACCPFHGEKTPSFHADDQRGRYHCFSCGASGDHFRFLTERTGISFPEAVEQLAGLAGVPMPARDPVQEKKAAERRSLYEVMELATAYFEAALAHNIGARARGYLNERGVTPSQQTRFRIGFSPESRNGLKEHLAANGVSAADMMATGLLAQREGDALTYDRFRNRLMFPIMDFRGRVIAFGGRALSADVPAKYLNSPETDLFHKRQTLYNGKDARQAAHDGKPVVVVEGYLDVIAAVAAGFEGAVAPLGTALTEDHLTLLWRMSDAPVLCFDGDKAGQKAAERTADMVLPLLKPGQTVKIAMLPDGLDPDDIIKQRGRDAFADLIKDSRPLSEMVWSMETRGIVPETPEARAALEMRLRERANAIADNSVRRHYAQAFDEKLQELFAPARDRYRQNSGRGGYNSGGFKNNRSGYGPSRGRGSPKLVVSDALKNSRLLKPGRVPEVTAREAVILMSLINHPLLVEPRLEALAALDFESPAARQVLGAVIDIVSRDHDITTTQMNEMLVARGFGELLEKMRGVLLRQGVWQTGDNIAEVDAETGLKHALALHSKSVQLNRELKAAEIALGDDLSDENLERLRDIQNQITSVDGTEALIEGFGSLSGRATRSF